MCALFRALRFAYAFHFPNQMTGGAFIPVCVGMYVCARVVPVEQRIQGLGCDDDVQDQLQFLIRHFRGSVPVVRVDAPSTLNIHLQRVSNSTQLLCYTVHAIPGQTICLDKHKHTHTLCSVYMHDATLH